jgi:hypothetical protein
MASRAFSPTTALLVHWCSPLSVEGSGPYQVCNLEGLGCVSFVTASREQAEHIAMAALSECLLHTSREKGGRPVRDQPWVLASP